MTDRIFDIEKIKAGARVVDRNGNEWQYVGSAPDDVYPHIFWKKDDGAETFTEDGGFIEDGDSDKDLTIAPTMRKAWVMYANNNSTIIPASNIHTDKEFLEKRYIDNIKDGWTLLEIEIEGSGKARQ